MKNPQLFSIAGECRHEPGMTYGTYSQPFVSEITLRDLFAAAALAGLGEVVWAGGADASKRAEVAAVAYEQADEMLRAREVGQK